MIGSTVFHFTITSKLGEGGFGVACRAEDTNLHRPVALKVLSAGGLAREDTRARFMREARTAAALNHPSWIERDTARDTALVNYYKAAIHVAAGKPDEALKWLEVALDKEFRDFVNLENIRYFASLIDDPRFDELLARYR